MNTRGTRVMLLAWLLSATAHGAAVGDNLVRLAPSKFKLAQNIGPMRFAGERKFSDRRLGRTFGYVTSGISLTIYVYDYGLRDLPDGPNSVAACEQFERAKDEIEKGGNYQNVVPRGESTRRMDDSAAAPLVREALYDFQRNGIDAVSALWVTAADGYFVKLRLSLRREEAEELAQARSQVLATVARSLAARPARAAPPVAALPETAIELDAAVTGDEASLWISYAEELLRVSRETPRSLPACGGLLAPGFLAEYSARARALHEYQSRDAAARNAPYFDELARVDAAGFLDEYVWYQLHTAESAPADLDLAAFEQFRARALAQHVYFTGARVRVNTVRILPMAD